MKLLNVGLISLVIFSTGAFAKTQLPVSAHNCKIVQEKLDSMEAREKVGSSTAKHAKRLRANIEMFEELKDGCLKTGLVIK
ncbi:MAG: hypothetical protein ABJH06_03705 [Paraglaciecola sp.]|uniref:hypothetical protein n=1 Tax=Paraglaciecola sp. TaxID=1920173 RepID=UPI003265B4A6